MKRSELIAAAAIATALVVGAASVEPLMAQIRAALVKDVDNGARQPFGVQALDFSFTATGGSADALTVPAGKRAVIEHVSCVDFLDASNNWVRMEMLFTSNGIGSRLQFVHERVGTSFSAGTDVWSFSQPVRAYADPGTTVSIAASRRLTSGLAGFECYLSGHYVDLAP